MNFPMTVRAEVRKLTTTRMPLAFAIVLALIGGATAIAVAFGTDMDGGKGFIATAADQQSLMAFASNAVIISGLFGAIAVAREYGHGTAVFTFLITPRRTWAVVAQFAAAFLGGFLLGFLGAAISATSIAIGLTSTDYGFMVAASDLVQVLGASALAGGAGAVIGAGLGALIRNTGGAVTGTILVLMILPPLAVQMVNETLSWIPGTIAGVMSGISDATSVAAALGALVVWAVVPAAIGVVAVNRRDVV